jgi:hypothetical protein
MVFFGLVKIMAWHEEPMAVHLAKIQQQQQQQQQQNKKDE